MEPSRQEMGQWCDRLIACGLAVRDQVRQALGSGSEVLAEPVAVEGGDTIYELDRRVEPVIEQQIASWPADCLPLILVAEGFGQDGRRLFEKHGDDRTVSREPAANTPGTRFRVLLDPIDGTRGLMYDKRAAWFLAAVAVDRGDETSLRDVFASVMVELPTTRHGYADHFFATRETRTQAVTMPLIAGDPTPPRHWSPRPSSSTTLDNGFAHVAGFFAEGKHLAADLLQTIVRATTAVDAATSPQVFDDQYISTGGQMAELIRGHDRFCCDVRPGINRILRDSGTPASLECHPYDMAGTLVAQQAGVVIAGPDGESPDYRFDVSTAVTWLGFANRKLQERITPIVASWLSRHAGPDGHPWQIAR